MHRSETVSKKSNFVTMLCERYAGRPVIRALVQLLPCGSSLNELMTYRADEMREERARTFFDALDKGDLELNEELIYSEPFLHAYFSTLRSAMRTRNREKIKVFAYLLRSALKEESNLDLSDDYEELLENINILSYREFAVLSLLMSFEDQNVRKDDQNDLEWVMVHWENFRSVACEKFDIRAEEFQSFLLRIARTGLYQPFYSGFGGPQIDKGRTTALFRRLAEYVHKHS